MDEVQFREVPHLTDFFPSSTKVYKDAVHEASGTTLKVG
jgi:hypothetical protein